MTRSSSSTQTPKPQPMVMRYVQPSRSGIQAHNYTRLSMGYVVRGRKCIYYGDTCHEIPQGTLFYMGTGNYYLEDIPESGKSFEQIIFYYTPAQLTKVLNNLSVIYQMHITNDHTCTKCEHQAHASYPANTNMKSFFTSVAQYLKGDLFSNGSTAEMLKITELVFLILKEKNCCMKSKILSNMDLTKESFEQIIQNYIFSDISVEELAAKCNRSLTSFKKEFRKHFYEPPHKWFIRQRLMYSRLLLISTNKSIAEIGNECHFPNTSHFIKLFKKEYEFTPSHYRNRHEQHEAETNKPVKA